MHARQRTARAMGGADRLARRAQPGRLDARARIAALLDSSSFTEIGALTGPLPADAFIAGVGAIDGRPVAVGAEDFTVAGGSIGRGAAAKRFRLCELALQERMPLVYLLEGAGHRPPVPGDPPGRRTPNDLQAQAEASGRIPMAAAVLGASAGHGALSVPLADFTVMTEAAAIFAAGPPLVEASLGEKVTKQELGGPDVALRSGVVHNRAADDLDAIDQIRRWLGYLPTSAWARPVRTGTRIADEPIAEVLELVPRSSRTAYDMERLIELIVDDATWFPIQSEFGGSLVTGLSRIDGHVVAIVANQPMVRAGTIDVAAADKAAQFISVADAFHLPLVFLTDNPGVMAGSESERAGILRHAGLMFKAQHLASVPKIQVTVRKAFGFGSSVMAMNPFSGQTLNLAFPGVTLGAMPARGADAATHADDAAADALAAAEIASVYRSADALSYDDVIDPRDVRTMIVRSLRTSAHRLTGPVTPKR